jgi:hypothetical protein
MPKSSPEKDVVALQLREILLRIKSENEALQKLIEGLKKHSTDQKKPNQKHFTP